MRIDERGISHLENEPGMGVEVTLAFGAFECGSRDKPAAIGESMARVELPYERPALARRADELSVKRISPLLLCVKDALLSLNCLQGYFRGQLSELHSIEGSISRKASQ